MGIDDESSHPELCSEVADGVTRNIVCLFREPDAGNLPVRFDEREQETELRQTGLRRVVQKHPNSHREAKAAPVLDSTRVYTHNPASVGVLSVIVYNSQVELLAAQKSALLPCPELSSPSEVFPP
jgi:hypothetical protein